jgi:hypothetical protein
MTDEYLIDTTGCDRVLGAIYGPEEDECNEDVFAAGVGDYCVDVGWYGCAREWAGYKAKVIKARNWENPVAMYPAENDDLTRDAAAVARWAQDWIRRLVAGETP